MSFRKIKNEIDKFGDSMNLQKKYPNYFNKKVFNTTTILLFVLFGVAFVSNDFKLNNVYAECKSDTICNNPFYLCSNVKIDNSQMFNSPQINCMPSISWKVKPLCDDGICNREFLGAGEVVGNKPNFFNEFFVVWVTFLYVGALGVNHLIYKRTK